MMFFSMIGFICYRGCDVITPSHGQAHSRIVGFTYGRRAQALIILGHQWVVSRVDLFWVLYYRPSSIGFSFRSCVKSQVI